MPRISLFRRMPDEDAFVRAWSAHRDGDGRRGLLLRSHSDASPFRFAEVVPSGSPPPELPVRAQSARYEPVQRGIPEGASFGWVWLNGYEATADADGTFQQEWLRLRATVEGLPGFVGADLHKGAESAATFAYVTVAAWETLDQMTAGVAGRAFADRAVAMFRDAHPAAFEVVRG